MCILDVFQGALCIYINSVVLASEWICRIFVKEFLVDKRRGNYYSDFILQSHMQTDR